MRVLLEDLVEAVPLSEELVLALFSVFDQRGVLQVLQVVFLPVHQNVRLFGPALKHVVMDRLLAQGHLVEDVGVQHIVLTK